MSTKSFTQVRKIGPEIETLFHDLAMLRICVFKDFPYLYEGSLDYEKKYLSRYFSSKRAFVFAIYHGSDMVGATSAAPLSDEDENFKQPFLQKGYDIQKIFYFGESLLLPNYRGQGFGHLFFDERETHAKKFNQYDWTTFCSVHRAENHSLRPSDYTPLDVFWTKRGYKKQNDLVASYDWQDVGEAVETTKKLTFWMKKI